MSPVIRVWEGRLGESPAADSTRPDLDRALALLSRDERVRASGMGSVAARTRFVLARATLRLLLARMAGGGTEPRDLSFRYGRRGKPYLPGGPSFNVSHSRDALVVAVAEKGRLGVDVEHVRSVRRRARVTARQFTPAEQEWIAAIDDGVSADEAFFRIWTRKEAFAKAFGRGLSAFRLFSVAPPPDESVSNGDSARPDRFGAQGGLAWVDVPGETAGRWTVTGLPCGGDYLAALAVDQPSALVAMLPDNCA